MEFIDTHTHLYLEHFDNDRKEVVERAIKNGIRYMLQPNIDLGSITPMHELCMVFHEHIKPMMGLHPTSVKTDYKEVLAKTEEFLNLNKYVAVGETGIDLYWDRSFISEQKESFRQHILWAEKYKLPLVIHSRNALAEIIQILNEYKHHKINGVFHCYPGDVRTAELLIKMGFLIGVGGTVTYKNSKLQEVVKVVGIEHIVLETDSPFLPPVPYRGQRNESSYIKDIALKISEITGLDIGIIASITTKNAEKLFNLEY